MFSSLPPTLSSRKRCFPLSNPISLFQSCLLTSTLVFVLQGSAKAAKDVLPVLIVGGGPNPTSNQAAIESNVRYVTKLLPEKRSTITLFADGKKDSATVLYRPEGPGRLPEEQILDALLQNLGPRRGRVGTPPAAAPGAPPTGDAAATAPVAPAPRRIAGSFKTPDIAQLDGASSQNEIEKAFESLGQIKASKSPTFLYFTGHGSKTTDNLENNYYNLWNGGKFTVRDLSAQLRRLPQQEPVVLVMVQCFSGSFGNILFEGGDPKAELIDRDIVGFFASTKDRVAAGCTPAVNEEYYYDFTSYFFSALTGRDRLNRKAAGDADFNRDGKVGLDEAYYWAVANDNSIDVPVATSDVFLEKFSPLQGEDWVTTPYSSLLVWASPAQRASLEGLSQALNLGGEDRIQQAQRIDFEARNREFAGQVREINGRFSTLRDEKRKAYLTLFPDLSSDDPGLRAEARRQATVQIGLEISQDQWKAFQNLTSERVLAQSRSGEVGVEEAKQLRFIRLAQKVVRDHNLRQSDNGAIKKRYFKLLSSESKTLLPYNG
jgi:hypothetical protein